MRYVAYLRVSTQKQGLSGLGLEAQRQSVATFLGQDDEIISEFIEVESGRKNARPRLAEALALAKDEKAVLLIAKLDRLGRNVAFIANLLEAGVEIAAVDVPEANRFVLHIMAAVGEQEVRATSERTKAALQAAKARGLSLGFSNPRRTDQKEAAALSLAVRARTADEFALRHGPRMMERRASGASFSDIARELNEQGVKSPKGGRWWPASVRQAVCRYEEIMADGRTAQIGAWCSQASPERKISRGGS